MKKIISIILSAVLFSALLVTACAADNVYTEPPVSENNTYMRVSDSASVISQEDLTNLNGLADSISDQYKCDVAVVFVESTGTQNIQAFADDLYDYGNYGYGDTDDGIMLVIAVNDRGYATTTYGYGTLAVTDNALDYIEEAFLDDLAESRWADAALDFINASGEILYDYAYVRQDSAGSETAELNPIKLIPINILIGLAIGFIAVGIMKGKHKSVRKQTEASDYLRRGSFRLTYSNDRFIRSQVTRTKRPEPQNNSASEFSGDTTTHTSSSGRTHGGRSGKF